MLARIQYALVGGALITLLVGFLQSGSNSFLWISIVLSSAALLLTVAGAVMRRRVSAAGAPAVAAQAEYPAAGEPGTPAEATALLEPSDEDVLADLSLDENFEEEDEVVEEPTLAAALDELDDSDLEGEEIEEAYDAELLDEVDEEEDQDQEPARRASSARGSGGRGKASASRPARAGAPNKRTAATKDSASRAAPRGRVVVVPGRDRYHRPDCRFVASRDDAEEITRATASKRDLEPCSACKPG